MTTNLPALRNDTVIVRLEAARTALAEAKTIQQSKAIADVAAAAEIYARRQKLGEEAIDFAHAIKIEALRKLGEMLKDTPKNAGSRGVGKSGVPLENPTLQELGLDKKTSSIAQKLANLPEKAFEEVKEGHKSIGAAISAVDKKRQKTPKAQVINSEVEALKERLAEATEQKNDLADTARELEDRLTAYEKTELDDQQKEIRRLQLRIIKLEAEIERLTRARNDAQAKNNELIREVKRLRRG